MSNRRDWYFLQQVTEAEMDDQFDQIEIEHARMLSRTLGASAHHGGTLLASEIRQQQPAGSIIGGGFVASTLPTPTKSFSVSYLTSVVQTEESADADFTELFMDDDATERAPMLANFGDPKVGSPAPLTTFDMTSEIAGVAGGSEANWRVYAVLKRTESDPRIDGNGDPVNFKRQVAMELQIDKDEGVAPHTGLPALRTAKDTIHLAVIGPLDNAAVSIVAGDITPQDRVYGGWSPFSIQKRGLIWLATAQDSFNVGIAGTGERVVQVAHNLNYSRITTSSALDQTVSGTRRILGYIAHDGGGGASADAFGLYKHLIEIEQIIHAQDAAGDEIGDVDILPLGATKTADAIGLEADDVSFRYLYNNRSGVAVDIVAFHKMRIYNNMGSHFVSTLLV